MTSKSLFFKLMREDIKRRLWAAGLAFLMFFFGMPVAAAMSISSLKQSYERWLRNSTDMPQVLWERYQTSLFELADSILGSGNLFSVFIVGLSALVLGLTGFHFLHSKKQVDFYNSLPVRREILFSVKYLNGFLIVFCMYLLNMLLAAAVFAANGVGIDYTFGPAFTAMIAHMAGFLLMYGLMTVAVLLTGNFFVSILGGLVLFFYIPLAVLLGRAMMELFFVTVSYKQTQQMMTIATHGSPGFYYGNLMQELRDLEHSAQIFPRVGMALLAALVFFGICLLLYKLRPSEAAGKSIAFRAVKFPIKLLVVSMIAIAMGLIFWAAYYRMSWAAFGFLLGVVIPHCLFEIICYLDFKKLFANLPQMGICAVAALAVIGIFRYDMFGYDEYLPGESSFQSAAVNMSGLRDWTEYGMPVKTGDKMSWLYVSNDDYVEENMIFTDYSVIKELGEAGIAWAKEEKPRRLHDGDAYYADGYSEPSEQERTYSSHIDICYRLKNGRTVYRNYYVDVNELRQAVDRMYASEEYKKGVYPILSYTADNVTGIYTVKNSEIMKIELNEEERAKLLAAYQEDLAEMTLAGRAVETPVMSLRFLTIAEHEYLRWISHNRRSGFNGDFELDDMNQVNYVPVYPSFTRTLALLNDAGIDAGARASVDDIAGIRLYHDVPSKGYSYDYDNHYDYAESSYASTQTDKDGVTLMIENDGTAESRKKIEEIIAASAPYAEANMNGLQLLNHQISIEVYFKDEEAAVWTEGSSVTYQFTDVEIPDFAAQILGYDSTAVSNRISYGLSMQK